MDTRLKSHLRVSRPTSLGVGGRVVGDHHAGPDVVVDRGHERPGAQQRERARSCCRRDEIQEYMSVEPFTQRYGRSSMKDQFCFSVRRRPGFAVLLVLAWLERTR
jgi:hypothetical protein